MPPRVLLSSVFKPFGVDSRYDRKESRIELYHNQLTKAQGVFSMRSFHFSFGLHAIAHNLGVPVTVLDYPTFDRFCRELRNDYDYVGIGAITPNFQKVKRMVEAVRQLAPRAKIVIGGFCANIPDLQKMLEVDYLCVGEGISFMRELLGLPAEFTFRDPEEYGVAKEVLGFPLFWIRYPHLVVGLGCTYGCDFCTPSHHFGRRHINFYRSGGDLFEAMVRMEKKYRSNLMAFMGDDNFLLDFRRAEELRQRVVDSGKIFKTLVFGSADRVAQFGPEKISELGVDSIWIGRESRVAPYAKNRGVNLAELVAELRAYGVKTILSSILLLDGHTKANVQEDIVDHLACRPVFSQFAHLSPLPGTPLYDRMKEEGRILTAIPFEEWHAFKQPWFIHPEFDLLEAERLQEAAYQRDFHELGPSLMRYLEAEYLGWRNLRNASSPYQRRRAEGMAADMAKNKVLLLAMEHLAPTDAMRQLIRRVRGSVESEFGPANPLHRLAARGLHLTGAVREFRTRHWGDALQPPTRVSHYPRPTD